MKANFIGGFGIVVFAALTGCTAGKPKPALTYYHGQTPPDSYFKVVRYTPQEIEFRIKVRFSSKHMYHLVLDGDNPLAEGWFPTALDAADSYRVVIKAPRGVVFETGKAYRLCIGEQSPEYVVEYRSTYQCAVDYNFVLPPK
jgi:hypothetical protein